MKKRTIALLLAACMTAGMLTACGGNTTSSAPAESSAPTTEAAAPAEETPAATPEPVVSVQDTATGEPVSWSCESACRFASLERVSS